LRIISGKYKGRSINPPGNLPVRPTTDFAKTGLFNILENRINLENTVCLDLFSGTGSISLELISRGSKQVTSVDLDFGCIQFQKECTKLLGITNLHPIRSDVLRYMKSNQTQYDLIFADPPFGFAQDRPVGFAQDRPVGFAQDRPVGGAQGSKDIRKELHDIIFNRQLLSQDGILILEHSSREKYEDLPGFNFSRDYGNVTFSFFFNLEPSSK